MIKFHHPRKPLSEDWINKARAAWVVRGHNKPPFDFCEYDHKKKEIRLRDMDGPLAVYVIWGEGVRIKQDSTRKYK